MYARLSINTGGRGDSCGVYPRLYRFPRSARNRRDCVRRKRDLGRRTRRARASRSVPPRRSTYWSPAASHPVMGEAKPLVFQRRDDPTSRHGKTAGHAARDVLWFPERSRKTSPLSLYVKSGMRADSANRPFIKKRRNWFLIPLDMP